MDTTPELHSEKGHRLTAPRLVVAVFVAAALFFAAGGPAEAATSYQRPGTALTDSGAGVLVMDTRCGVNNANLSINFGGTLPNYFAVQLFNATTGVKGPWTAWQPVTASNMYWNPLITTPGNWIVSVKIAHYYRGYWYYDTEQTYHTNTVFPYSTTGVFCHVGR